MTNAITDFDLHKMSSLDEIATKAANLECFEGMGIDEIAFALEDYTPDEYEGMMLMIFDDI